MEKKQKNKPLISLAVTVKSLVKGLKDTSTLVTSLQFKTYIHLIVYARPTLSLEGNCRGPRFCVYVCAGDQLQLLKTEAVTKLSCQFHQSCN